MLHQSLCDEWMNKWPVIFVSFRQIDGLDFESACEMLSSVIAELFNEHLYLLDDEKITEYQKRHLEILLQERQRRPSLRTAYGFLQHS